MLDSLVIMQRLTYRLIPFTMHKMLLEHYDGNIMKIVQERTKWFVFLFLSCHWDDQHAGKELSGAPQIIQWSAYVLQNLLKALFASSYQ